MKLYYDKPESLSAAISGERRGIMNREILFRAKRIGDGKWFEGYYCGGTESGRSNGYGEAVLLLPQGGCSGEAV